MVRHFNIHILAGLICVLQERGEGQIRYVLKINLLLCKKGYIPKGYKCPTARYKKYILELSELCIRTKLNREERVVVVWFNLKKKTTYTSESRYAENFSFTKNIVGQDM